MRLHHRLSSTTRQGEPGNSTGTVSATSPLAYIRRCPIYVHQNREKLAYGEGGGSNGTLVAQDGRDLCVPPGSTLLFNLRCKYIA